MVFLWRLYHYERKWGTTTRRAVVEVACQLYHYERKWGATTVDKLTHTLKKLYHYERKWELRQCLCPKYSVMISPPIISAFTVFVNPQMERNVFNKNSPWKWMLPSLEFPWQALIRMTAEMQFAF